MSNLAPTHSSSYPPAGLLSSVKCPQTTLINEWDTTHLNGPLKRIRHIIIARYCSTLHGMVD